MGQFLFPSSPFFSSWPICKFLEGWGHNSYVRDSECSPGIRVVPYISRFPCWQGVHVTSSRLLAEVTCVTSWLRQLRAGRSSPLPLFPLLQQPQMPCDLDSPATRWQILCMSGSLHDRVDQSFLLSCFRLVIWSRNRPYPVKSLRFGDFSAQQLALLNINTTSPLFLHLHFPLPGSHEHRLDI